MPVLDSACLSLAFAAPANARLPNSGSPAPERHSRSSYLTATPSFRPVGDASRLYGPLLSHHGTDAPSITSHARSNVIPPTSSRRVAVNRHATRVVRALFGSPFDLRTLARSATARLRMRRRPQPTHCAGTRDLRSLGWRWDVVVLRAGTPRVPVPLVSPFFRHPIRIQFARAAFAFTCAALLYAA